MTEPTKTNEPTLDNQEDGSEGEEEDDEEDYTDTFSFDVHFCLSKGRCAYTFEEVKACDDGFEATISQENSDLMATATFTSAQIAEIQKCFEEDEATELAGNCFCTIESQPEHALQELKLLAEKGKSRTPPTREELTERTCQAFAKLEDPDYETNMTGGDKWRFFISLFNMEVFENDQVSAAWVKEVAAKVSELSGGKVTVTTVPLGEFPEDRGVNSVRDIRLKVSDGKTSLFVEILPATNGWYSVKK